MLASIQSVQRTTPRQTPERNRRFASPTIEVSTCAKIPCVPLVHTTVRVINGSAASPLALPGSTIAKTQTKPLLDASTLRHSSVSQPTFTIQVTLTQPSHINATEVALPQLNSHRYIHQSIPIPQIQEAEQEIEQENMARRHRANERLWSILEALGSDSALELDPVAKT